MKNKHFLRKKQEDKLKIYTEVLRRRRDTRRDRRSLDSHFLKQTKSTFFIIPETTYG